jgi:hypothetical protein
VINNWSYLQLSTTNLGTYEPTYDATLWKERGILNLFFEPVGLGSATAPVSVLEWNARRYFAALHPMLGDLNLDGDVTNLDIQAMLAALADPGVYMSSRGLNANDLVALGDFNGDGGVNQNDLQPFLNALANGPAGQLVPEPNAWLLFVLGVGVLVVLRTRVLDGAHVSLR